LKVKTKQSNPQIFHFWIASLFRYRSTSREDGWRSQPSSFLPSSRAVSEAIQFYKDGFWRSQNPSLREAERSGATTPTQILKKFERASNLPAGRQV